MRRWRAASPATGTDRLGPADWVTLARATLAVGVAALVADSFEQPAPVALLVTLAAVALALDAVDGWIVRRTGTASPLGAHFDGEVDAFLILVLSVYVARSAGAWVLAIGAARYAFLAAGWLLPWMREPLPPRYWRKVVAATQGIVLTIAAADVAAAGSDPGRPRSPRSPCSPSRSAATCWWLWSRRHATHAPCRGCGPPTARTPAAERGRVRTGIAVALTILALARRVGRPRRAGPAEPPHARRVRAAPARGPRPRRPGRSSCPPPRRRLLACVVGPVLGLLVIVKILDMGFFETFDRPFDPVADGSYTGIGIETLRDSIGRTEANLLVAGAAVLGVAVLVLTTLAVLRLTRVAAGHRRWSLRAVAALGVVWVLCWVFGAQLVSDAPIASTSAAGLVVHEVRAVRAGVEDHAVFADEIRHDRFRNTPADQLLTGLRGKDVLLVFVESYGKVAVQDSSFSPKVDAVLDKGTRQLRAAGFSARSGFLTSSTFGGLSWLAHSTMQSGLWVDNQLRYDQLVKTNRLTLSDGVQAGRVADRRRRAVERPDLAGGVVVLPLRQALRPAQRRLSRPEVLLRVHARPVRLPRPCSASSSRSRTAVPLFAEVDLVSSHTPWTRIPRLIDWNDVGDGSIFKRHAGGPADAAPSSSATTQRVRAAYGQSIEYTMNALVSFVQHYGDNNLVLVVLGDHQPAKVVTGENPSHDVPISVIAHDPAVLDRIAGWGWQDGLRPEPAGAGLADERLPRPLPQRVRLVARRRQEEVERVCAPPRLRHQVAGVRGRQVHARRHLPGDGHPEPAELLRLVRVVAEQGDPRDSERLQHLRGDQVAALVLAVTEREVRLVGVRPVSCSA